MINWFPKKSKVYSPQQGGIESEQEKRRKRCSFTGHRPEKLSRSETEIKADLEDAICNAIDDGYNVFISGMARGVDIWAAQIVLQLRHKGYPIRLICAIPYPGFEKPWSLQWQKQYTSIIRAADLVRYISPEYSYDCFQVRNEWIVNHSSRVIAVYSEQQSGTKNTIDYAKRCHIPVYIIRG